MPTDVRLLLLVNPGAQSRFYMLGLLRAAQRMGIPHQGIELQPLWNRLNKAADKVAATTEVSSTIADLVAKERFTHVVGYGYNGIELSRPAPPGGAGTPIFAELGLRHLMLWTDHPNWMSNALPLEPHVRAMLRNDRHVHFLKSPSAAAEAAAVLNWPNVHAIDMAEDYELLKPDPLVHAVHDVVAIVGSTHALPVHAQPFLSHDDPDPAAIDALGLPTALAEVEHFIRSQPEGDARVESVMSWARAVTAEKLQRPMDAYWRIASGTPGSHTDAFAWLRADAKRWYGVTRSLRTIVEWRRNFWLAWLSRRVNVGIYGASAEPIGVAQPAGAERWVDYLRQGGVYNLGRLAINTNAAHDEEGCTHKPFQIASSEVPCIHHAGHGLAEAFEPGSEILTFTRGPELLRHVRQVAPDIKARRALAGAAHQRLVWNHTWDARLSEMLRLAGDR